MRYLIASWVSKQFSIWDLICNIVLCWLSWFLYYKIRVRQIRRSSFTNRYWCLQLDSLMLKEWWMHGLEIWWKGWNTKCSWMAASFLFYFWSKILALIDQKQGDNAIFVRNRFKNSYWKIPLPQVAADRFVVCFYSSETGGDLSYILSNYSCLV